jgi:hypothetical protein
VLTAGLTAVLFVVASGRLECATKPDKYAQLEQKLKTAEGAKRSEILAQLAFLDYDRARASYDAGKPEDGLKQLEVARQHAQDAMTFLNQEATHHKSHGMKQVEIQFRKIAFGLRDLSRSITLEERPPVEAAMKYFSESRDAILRMMFGGQI